MRVRRVRVRRVGRVRRVNPERNPGGKPEKILGEILKGSWGKCF